MKNVKLHVRDDYVATTVYAQQDDDIGYALCRILASSPHIINFMWRADFRRLGCARAVKDCAAVMDVSEAEVLDRLCQSHVTFSVSDHLFLDEASLDLYRSLFWLSDGYLTNSGMLYGFYSNIAGYPAPAAVICNGVDTDFYRPADHPRAARSAITIGWVGNSSWGEGQGLTDSKGLKTIVRPTVGRLRAKGYDIKLLIIDRAER